MKAVVLAGGFGTRINPLTHSMPKPMLPLAGKPILEHIVELLKGHGITDLIFLLYFKPEMIKNHFGDGSDFGVTINYTLPAEDYGTAGAVKAASEYITDDEPFIVMSGDLLTDVDIGSIIDYHKEKDAMVAIGLTSVQDPLQFGIVITDNDGAIIKFLEKPGWGEVFTDAVNAGVYVLSPSVMQHIPPQQPFDFSADLFPSLLSDGRSMYGYLLQGYWRDVGDTTSYWMANADILAGKVKVKGTGQRLDILGKNIWVGEGSKIGEDVGIEGTVIIGSNTKLLGNAVIKDCVIGSGALISEGVNVEGTILWDDISIDNNTVICDSVICSNVTIGKNVVIERGCVVAEGCEVGDGAVLKEGVKVWPSKEIESRAIVSSNLIWGERWKRTLFEESKVKGLANFELTPELAAKLGAAFGSFLPKGSTVLMGRDSYRAPRMIKRAFVAGALAAGINVNDMKDVPIPVFRYKLASHDEVGGAYFRYSFDNPEVTEILFYDKNGLETSAAFEKSFERIFQR